MSDMGTDLVTRLYLGTHSRVGMSGWTPSVQGRRNQGLVLFQRFPHEVLLYGGFLRIETFPSGGSREAPDTNATGLVKRNLEVSGAPTPLLPPNPRDYIKRHKQCQGRGFDHELKGRAFSVCLAD